MAAPGARRLLSGEGVKVLIVGSGAYRRESRLSPIPSVGRTVTDLGACLVERAGLDPANLETLVDADAPQQIAEALERSAREASKVLVFYYVGHGLVSIDGELHLATAATVDLTDRVAGYQALPYSVVREVLTRSHARTVVVVLDCCFAGRAQGISGSAADDAFDNTRWIGSYLLTSTSRDELAWAPRDERHTAFSGELIRIMTEGDPLAPRLLTLDDVYRVLNRVLRQRRLPPARRQAADELDREPLVDNASYAFPPPPEAPPSIDDGQHSPYQGLSSFGPDDTAYFFGREQLTFSLAQRIREHTFPGRPWLVTGPSGSGKSSLLRAGLIPALSSEPGPSDGERWSCVYLTPGNDPFEQLVRKMSAAMGVAGDVLRARLEHAASLREDLGRPEQGAADPAAAPSRVVLVVDQFEQIFTECDDIAQRLLFIRALGSVCESRTMTVVMGLRSDFFGHCADHPELLPALRHADVVPPMTAAELREVIEKPAELAGLTLETGLADLLLEECGSDSEIAARGPGGVLPLLSHALLQTWQRRQNGVLTLAGYRATGGIAKSLSQTADVTLDGFPPTAEPLARRMFVRMVRLEDGLEDTRRRVPLTDLQAHLEQEQRAEAGDLLGKFVDARLVSVDGGFAELTHEALIRHWPRLRSWIDEDRSGVLVRQRIEDAASTWDANGRHTSFLDRGPRLSEAMAWAETHPGELGPLASEFLRAGVRAHSLEKKAERRRARLRRQAIVSLAALLVLAVTGGGVAVKARSDADRDRVFALSRQVAARADALRGLDPSLAMGLSLVAYRISPTEEAGNSLLSVPGTPAATRLLGHDGPVRNVAFRPDAKILASVGADDTVRLWDVSLRRQVTMLPEARLPKGGPSQVVWSPDGAMMLVGSTGEAPWQLWDVKNPGDPRLVGPLALTAQAWTAAVRPDGRVLATSGTEGPTILWTDIFKGRPVAVLKGNLGGAADLLAFAPNGRTLLEAPIISYAGLWDVADPRKPKLTVIVPDSYAAHAAAFSRDSRRLAISGFPQQLSVFDIKNTEKTRRIANLKLAQDTNLAVSLSFNADGSLLGAANLSDNMVRIWDVATKRVVFSLPHVGNVLAVDFAPVGNSIATGGNDGIVRIWPLDAWPIGVHTNMVNAVSFSPDGELLASSGIDAVRVWNVPGGTALRKASEGDGQSTNPWATLTFGPDGRTLFTSDQMQDGTPYRLDRRLVPAEVPLAKGSRGWVGESTSGMALRGDARLLAVTIGPQRNTGEAVVDDPRIELWSLDGQGRRKAVMSAWSLARGDERSTPLCLAFGPAGHTLVAGTNDGAIRVWDVRDPAHPRDVTYVRTGKTQINSIAFARGGEVLATASSNGTVRLWDVSGGVRLTLSSSLNDANGNVSRLAFDRTGTTLATVGDDRLVRLYRTTDPRSPTLLATLQGHTAAIRSVAFNPADDSIATAAEDNTVRLWDTNKDRIASRICATSGSGITPEEWRTYVPGVPYSPPCP